MISLRLRVVKNLYRVPRGFEQSMRGSIDHNDSRGLVTHNCIVLVLIIDRGLISLPSDTI